MALEQESEKMVEGRPLAAIYNCQDSSGASMDQPESAIQPRALKQQQRANAKRAEVAERMKPRACRFCQGMFTPKRVQDWKSEFCTRQHQAAFWVKANQLSAAVLKGEVATPAPQSELKPGVSHKMQVLAILERHVNEWVEHPRQLLPGVVWNSRVADLRRRGYKIETRRVGQSNYDIVPSGVGNRRKIMGRPGGTAEYQYRLVREEKA